jgi:hypothetical protein
VRALPRVETFTRDEFLSQRWRYSAGEHVSFLGPTQSGKTTLGFQLMAESATPKLPAEVLVMKPRDSVVASWTKSLGFRRVKSWPPVPSLTAPRPPGYTLWPKPTFDFHRDNATLAREFQKCLQESYRKGNRIIFADEVWGLTNELGLTTELVALWSRGASMGAGLWAATQRPSHVPLWMYSQAHHLFLSYEPDARARDRFAEIGGLDPHLVKATVMALKKYQWLYIRRDGPALCIVDK